MKLLKTALVMLPMAIVSSAQTYDLTPQLRTAPRYVSVKVPDGNYMVTAVIGSDEQAALTTVRAENRRLMAENIVTGKGETAVCTFTVNKRNAAINDTLRVSLKPEEEKYFTWDEELTFEICGDKAAVKSLKAVRTDSVTTIYLCGNSTVTDQYEEPWASWGQMLPRWFDEHVSVANYAHSGLSATTFLAHKRLEKILTTLKEGDVVIVEFGHNDQKETGAGKGAWYNFTTNLKVFVDKVREKGGTVVFCTPTRRRAWNDDKTAITNTHGDYPQAMKAVAARENVPVIDLHELTREFFETLGYEGSKRALVHYPANTFANQSKPLADNTHFNPYGAYEVAKMVVAELQKSGLPVAKHIRPEFTGFDPKHPDDPTTFVWSQAKMTGMEKSDGD